MEILIFLSVVIGIPLIIVQLISFNQYICYKKEKRKNETYNQFCKRKFVRYV